jgi:uncharacterized protein (TIGR03437 family)
MVSRTTIALVAAFAARATFAQTLTSGVPLNFSLNPVSTCTIFGNWPISVPAGATQLKVDMTVTTPNVRLNFYASVDRVTAQSLGGGFCAVGSRFSASANASSTEPGTIILNSSSSTKLRVPETYYIAIFVPSLSVTTTGTVTATVTADPSTPAVADGGVLNAASFAKDAQGQGTPVAVGSLVSIFGTNLASTLAAAEGAPFPATLGGVSVAFNNVVAPMRNVIPGAVSQLNVQVPFNVLPAGQTSGTANVVVSANGLSSTPKPVQIVPVAPGVFSIPPGVGNAVLVTSDGKLAAPTSAAASLGFPTRPIRVGERAFFYAAGLGAMTPPLKEGLNDLTTTHTVNVTPVVRIGGIAAVVEFAGQAPEFPGVYQVNIIIPNNAPIGDRIPLQIESGGALTTAQVTIAIGQ